MNSETESIRIFGKVESVLYQNNENGYSVCSVESDDGDFFNASGNMPYISVGERLEMLGKWVNHKVYGKQFAVESFQKILPTQKNDILRYLSSGAVKGIGPKIAQKIVEIFAEDTFDVISKHPDWLVQIKGISASKAQEMSKDFNEKAGIREIIMFGRDKFSPTVALKIYKAWGTSSLEIIKSNPYIMCESINGITFALADEIALQSGVAKDDGNRIKSALIFVLRTFATRDGHTYVTRERLLQSTAKFIELDEDRIYPYIDALIFEDKIKSVSYQSETHIYLKENYLAEEYIAQKLLLLKKTVMSMDYRNSRAFIEQIEERNGISYAKMQKRAIEESLMNGVTVITGGPGTGKTTIIKALIQIFGQIGLRCALCAPTGRASQRMSEATSHEATTVHKLLEANSGTELDEGIVFDRNEKNLLEKEVIIVDESSMLDIHLACALLKAVKPGARVVLIGDVYQLPSVGEGDVLNDVIFSGCFPVIELNEIFRQAEQSGIVMNAHEINNGIVPDLTKRYEDFFFISIPNESQIPAYIAELCTVRLPKTYGIDPYKDIQVITPTKRGLNGTQSLNLAMQNALNPQKNGKQERQISTSKLFREGDKVMQIRNNYTHEWQRGAETGTGIFNGDVGTIKSINSVEKSMVVDFDGKVITLEVNEADEIEHAYAITVHKSQGSEYPFVIIPMTKSAPMLLTRNLIYTAITRASRMVILLGEKKVFEQMVENDSQIVRNTGLFKLLRSFADEN